MRLNQVTITMPDLDAAWSFYGTLGLTPIVDARPRYVRFACPDGDSTFSVDQGEHVGSGTTVYFECEDLEKTVGHLIGLGISFATLPEKKSWLWKEAELFDPAGNRVVLYFAGRNRFNPPWRVDSGEKSR